MCVVDSVDATAAWRRQWGEGTAIRDKSEFVSILANGSGDDVGAMELVAMELKAKVRPAEHVRGTQRAQEGRKTSTEGAVSEHRRAQNKHRRGAKQA